MGNLIQEKEDKLLAQLEDRFISENEDKLTTNLEDKLTVIIGDRFIKSEHTDEPITLVLRPNAAGDATNLTPSPKGSSNYADVDDVTPDETTTYVKIANGSENYDLYGIPSVANIKNIEGVTLCFRAKQSGDGSAKASIKIGGSVYYGDLETLTTSFVTYSYQWLTNPYTGLVWTLSDINNLQIGVYLLANLAGESDCTQVYAEVLAVED